MGKQLTLVTRKGQTTIPAAVRKQLGLREGDTVSWSVEDGHARLQREESVVERTRGMFRHHGPVLTAEELRVAAEIAIAEACIERSRP